MGRIPVIEQTTSVSPVSPTPQAQAFHGQNNAGQLLQLASQGVAAYNGIQEKLQAKDDADAVANTGKPLSDADVKWKQYVVDTSASTQDGGMVKNDDGSVVGLRAKTEKDFDEWSTGFLSGIKNPKAKMYAQDHINRLRTSTLDHAIGVEAQLGVANRTGKVDEAVDTWAGAAAKDSSNVGDLVQSAKIMIANSGFDEVTRNRKAAEATQRINEAALMGATQRDPRAAKSALVAKYGIDPTSAPAKVYSGGGFGQALAFTMAAEGGLNAADTNGTPSNFGINQAAHPEVDVTKLTKDQAGAIYKKDYWDFIGGDALSKQNPALALAAFDTAVLNKAKAKEFLAASGGDVGRFMDMREGFLQNLLAKDPAKYGKYKEAWNTRNADLRKQALAATSDGGPAAPDSATGSVSYSPEMADMVSKIPPERVQQFLNHATALANQQQAQVRSQVESTQADHLTAFRNGETVAKPMTQDEYVGAYGPVEGPERFKNYQSVQAMGHDIGTMKAMPPDQMNNMVDRYKPDPNSKGYALANERYGIMVQAREQVNNARASDPMAYAMSAKIGDAAPLNFQDPKAFGAELAKRQGIATTMAETYQTPFSLLTKNEVSAMSSGFNSMTTQNKARALGAIKEAVTNPAAYLSIMAQIAPDSPVTAMAGVIMSKKSPVTVGHTFGADEAYQPQDVASLILEGEALINPSKGSKAQDGAGKVFPMPKEQDIRKAFDDVVGKAYAGAPKIADFDYQAVKAYYAGKLSRLGDISGETNQGVLKEAITAVTGGVSDINGSVIRPWGMSERNFKDRVKYEYGEAISAAGLKGSPVDDFGAYSLQKIGDTKFMLKTGTGTLADKAGNPIVLDLSSMQGDIPKTLFPSAPPEPAAPPLGMPGHVRPGHFDKPVTQAPRTK